MIKDKSLIVRLDIVHALSRIGGAKAVEILVKMRSDNNENSGYGYHMQKIH